MALPFTLSSWAGVDVSNESFEIVSNLINEQNVTLKVVSSQQPSTKQLCDIFTDGDTNVTELVNIEVSNFCGV